MSLLNSKSGEMRYNNLGNSGLLVSELSLGCMTFTDGDGAQIFSAGKSFGKAHGGVNGERAVEMMKIAFEHGVNYFDNAENYGGGGVSERIMGEAIQMGIDRGYWERSDLVVSTKLFGGGRGKWDTVNSIGLSRKHIVEGMTSSLKRMGLEYVDLVFCHRPDPRTPIEETVRGMNYLLQHGLAFYWGTSEWSAAQLERAIACADRLGLVPPLMDQCQYNMMERGRVEVEYRDLTPALGLTTWSPLASGALTGKYLVAEGGGDGDGAGGAAAAAGAEAEGLSADSRFGYSTQSAGTRAQSAVQSLLSRPNAAVRRLAPIADSLKCTVAQLAIAWCAANPNVSTVILGATRAPQLEENLLAVRVVRLLTPALMAAIEEAIQTTPRVDPVTVGVERQRGRGRGGAAGRSRL
jgi:voltage-dependent potassium channel beta subunit